MNRSLLNLGVYGVGQFGYALLRHLEDKCGRQINLRAYDYEDEIRHALQKQRAHPLYEHRNLLTDKVHVVDSVEELIDSLDILVLAVTSHSTREVLANIAEVPWKRPLILINSAKALDYRTGCRLSELASQIITDPPEPFAYMALAGGTIASELLRSNPLGLTIASNDYEALRVVQPIFRSPRLWVQASADLIGVEYAGAFKNVISMCAGMIHGLDYSYGAETFLISRMANEIERFCVRRLGAVQRTFSIGSQCWGNDMWMSCTGGTRNRALGQLIGQGKTLDEALSIMARQKKTVEGVQTLQAIGRLLEKYPDDLQLTNLAKLVMHGERAPMELLMALLTDETF